MEYIKFLYGDLVKFVVEFQNKSGRNIQYKNFLFEMGNWSAKPGFNAQSNDQFSKIINNNKKPINAFYKYNSKIIHYLCSIPDNDVAIFPVDMEKRKELMDEILNTFFNSTDRENSKYVKAEEYHSNNDFENFMMTVFDFAHYNSVEYFKTNCKKEVKSSDAVVAQVNDKLNDDATLKKPLENIPNINHTSQDTTPLSAKKLEGTDICEGIMVLADSIPDTSNKMSRSGSSDFIRTSNSEQESCCYELLIKSESSLDSNYKDTRIRDNSHEKPPFSYAYNNYRTLNFKRKTILILSFLLSGMLIGVFLFSFVNRNSYESLAFSSNSQKQWGPVQFSKKAEESTYLNDSTTYKSINDSDKKNSANKDNGAKQNNPPNPSKPVDPVSYSASHPTVKSKNYSDKKQSNPTRYSQAIDKAASVDNYPAAKSKNGSEKNTSENVCENRKEQTNIIIVGNGVYTVGDRNIVNIN